MITGYDLEEKPSWEMIDGDSLAFEEYAPVCDLLRDSPNEAYYMQFTGLLDNDRKEIYDKDILRVFYDGREFYCVVEWNQQMAGWYLKMSDPKRYLEINALAMYGDENGIVLTSAFVAGNDFEHPHLLTQ